MLLCHRGGNDIMDMDVIEDKQCGIAPTSTFFLEDTNQNRIERRTTLGFFSGTKRRRQTVILTTPPDGGWGWVVVFSSFAISMLVDGVAYTFGIFFDEFREEFHTTKAETSLVGVVLTGTFNVIGPMAGALVKMYGCRVVAFSGAVLASIAFFVSTFSSSISVLILTFGVMGGFGFGFMYLPAIVMVGYYFERRRAFATGIACCGSGVGTFVFAPLCEYLIYEYGWRGAMWIISALVLNGTVLALFYRPLTSPPTSLLFWESTNSTTTAKELSNDTAKLGQSHIQTVTGEGRDIREPLSFSPMADNLRDGLRDVPGPEIKLSFLHGTRSVQVDESSQPKVSIKPGSSDLDIMWHQKRPGSSSVDVTNGSGVAEKGIWPFINPMLRKDIFFNGNLQHLNNDCIREHVNSGYGQSESQAPQNNNANHSAKEENSSLSPATGDNSLGQAISTILDLSLLKSPTFLIYATSSFLCMAGFLVPFIYLPSHVIDLGLDSWYASSLISIIGISNTIMRTVIGYIADKSWADCLLLNNVALFIGGSATLFVTYLSTYDMLASYATLFGFSLAICISLRSIIMVELMGLERLTTAFGMVSMCQGIAIFLGGPIAGFLSDTYGNYDATFYLAGASVALSGIICIPLRRIARWEGERRRQQRAPCYELNWWDEHKEVFVTDLKSDAASFCLNKKTLSKDNPDSHLKSVGFVDLEMIGSSVDKPVTKAGQENINTGLKIRI